MKQKEITIEHIYKCITNKKSTLADEFKPLRGLDIDELQEKVDALDSEAQARLKTWAHLHKMKADATLLGTHFAPIVQRRTEVPKPKVQNNPPVSNKAEKGTKGYYAGIFDDIASRENYTEGVWQVRELFLKDLNTLGGIDCTSCARNSLVRKYTRMLHDLDL